MTNSSEPLSLTNVCGGAVEERFQRELQFVLENIADVNTNAEAKRTIVFEFTLKPYDDRSGAEIEFVCKSKIVPTETVKGRLFISGTGAQLVAHAHDPRQIRMFEPGGGEKKTDFRN